MRSKFREPVSGFTHLLGALLSILGLILLVLYSLPKGNISYVVTFIVFGISLILLYTASSIYHLLTVSEKAIKVLRRIDHSMIYVLIAGTYTPICIIALKGRMGWTLFASVWFMAILGIVLKLLWFNAPRWLYTMFYVIMGWVAVFVLYPLAKAMPLGAILWLVGGGIAYTVGAIIYATKWPKITTPHFGFHEIFHIFVLLGSFCHYWLMFRYLMKL